MSDEELALHIGKDKRSVKTRRAKFNFKRQIQPGTYDYLYEFLRKRNREWKKASAKNCKYECVLSGEKFDNIHHLYGMNMIVSEALNNLRMPNTKYDQYNENDLELILEEFLRVQSKYPLGVCLTKKIHKEFHDKYGYGDNSPEQFYEFINIKQHYKNPVTTTAS